MENKPKVILLNAPPRAGKDDVSNFLWDSFYMNQIEAKDQLVKIARAIAQMDNYEWSSLYNSRETKELPTKRLFGRSPRKHLIYVAEEVIKPAFGKDYFGNIIAGKIHADYSVVSDIGFIEEVTPIINKVGQENVTLIRIHREGSSFEEESRGWLRGICDREFDVSNDGTLEELFIKVASLIPPKSLTPESLLLE